MVEKIIVELNEQELNQILLFLNRTDLKGHEVGHFVSVVSKFKEAFNKGKRNEKFMSGVVEDEMDVKDE